MNNSSPTDSAAELMAKYGITRVPADQFHYKDYRYSKITRCCGPGQAGLAFILKATRS